MRTFFRHNLSPYSRLLYNFFPIIVKRSFLLITDFRYFSTFFLRGVKTAFEKAIKTVAFREKMLYNDKAVRRWGGSGTLYLQSAIAERNAFLDDVYGRLARSKERW